MADLRLIEDLVPLIDLPAQKAVETLEQLFGKPKVLELPQRNSRPIAWPKAGVVITPGVTDGTSTISIYLDGADGFEAFRGMYSETTPLPHDRKDVRESL